MGLRFIIIAFLFFNPGGIVLELVQHTNIQKDELLVTIFYTPGNCAKCYIELENILLTLQKNRGSILLKYMAIIRCDREIEAKSWVKENKWQYYYWMDEGDMRKQMGLQPEILIAVFDFKGKKLIDFKRNNPSENVNKAATFIKELQP